MAAFLSALAPGPSDQYVPEGNAEQPARSAEADALGQGRKGGWGRGVVIQLGDTAKFVEST